MSATTGIALLPCNSGFIYSCVKNSYKYKLSLAEWSVHRDIENNLLDHLDFPLFAKTECGIDAVEYVSTFFRDSSMAYIKELHKKSIDVGVKNVLIMVDNEGYIGDLDKAQRTKSIENHYKWVDAAKILGCHSIRVNAGGMGSEEEVSKATVDGLNKLSEYSEKQGICVIVENHGGYSSNAKWLFNVISNVNRPNCGTLPDFGNFCIKKEKVEGEDICVSEYDRYMGMKELMPYAKGVSAKSYSFNDAGNETTIDYRRILEIVKKSGYKGYIGIEYAGEDLSSKEGILATKKLIERVFSELE